MFLAACDHPHTDWAAGGQKNGLLRRNRIFGAPLTLFPVRPESRSRLKIDGRQLVGSLLHRPVPLLARREHVHRAYSPAVTDQTKLSESSFQRLD